MGKKQMFCVGDSFKMIKHKAWATMIVDQGNFLMKKSCFRAQGSDDAGFWLKWLLALNPYIVICIDKYI